MDGLSSSWIQGLAKLCSIENEEKATALRERLWGAESLDDLLTLADVSGSELSLPRGFKEEFESILQARLVPYKFIDSTVSNGDPLPVRYPQLREEQADAYYASLHDTQGRIIMPPGRGKTVLGIAMAHHRHQKSVILVDKKHIAQQWVDNAKEHFDLDIGFIGDNRWEEEEITVALIQTIWSRKEKLGDWFGQFGFVLLDEQHHIPADTYSGVVGMFPAKYRYGFSATIGKSKAKKRVSELVFGPILYQSHETDIKPVIKVVDTGYDFGYHPTNKMKLPNGKYKVVRNNYTKMMSDLCKDTKRNEVIAQEIVQNHGRCNLVVSNRKNHLDNIEAIIRHTSPMPVYRLTGDESLEERMEIYDLADKSDCVIFSTLGVAGEALDIPRIDRVYLAYPMKNEETVLQVIGRALRHHPDKTDTIVYDFRDTVGVLNKQYQHRLRKLYQNKEWMVEVESSER
jgi:superfamily II DNA or RNA helicase